MAEILFTGFIFNILVIAVSFLVLNWASNLAINNAVKLATITRIGKTAIGFSLIAFSTSLPELTVAFIAALSGGAALSVGNVLGSNIFNISVIIGLAAVLLYLKSRRKKNKAVVSNGNASVIPAFAKSELSSIHFGLFISSIIPMILIYINTATWIVGLILIAIFVGYMYKISKVRMPQENGEVAPEEKSKLKRYLLFTILGALGVVVSAYFLVESAVGIAHICWHLSANNRCNHNCFWHKPSRTNLRFESIPQRSLRTCLWRHYRKQFRKYYFDFGSNSFRSSTCWFASSI